MPSIRIEDAAYAAGFFDGEGCISIVYQTPRKKHRGRYWLAVSLSQNCAVPLEWLQSRFGGTVKRKRGKRSYDRGTYERWDWVVSTSQALLFLRTIRPFLMVKAEQADLAFQFAETIVSNRRRTPDDVQATREILFRKMRSTKHAA